MRSGSYPPPSLFFFFPSLLEATAYGVQLYGAGSPNPSAVMAEWATAYKYHRDDVTYVSFYFYFPSFGLTIATALSIAYQAQDLTTAFQGYASGGEVPSLFPQLEFCRAGEMFLLPLCSTTVWHIFPPNAGLSVHRSSGVG